MSSSIFTHQKYDFAKNFIWDIPGCASYKLSSSFGCKILGIITQFPHIKQLCSVLNSKAGLKVFLLANQIEHNALLF